MPRTKTKTLTEAELRLMDVLWSRGPSTVADVAEALVSPKLAYNSVLTTLRILEQKGFVSRARRGRAHVYEPVVKKRDARRQAIRHLLERFFNDSPELLMQNLLEDEDWDPAHLEELQRRVSEALPARSQGGRPGPRRKKER